MRIQHNIMAMNAYRNYNKNNSALSKNLEKLSSGFAINRAGDDAAGLAISEKMRAQITGLDTAQKNVKDGISLVKTAEGAMQEIHDMLNRMDALATQSANGTYDNEVDRANLQKEIESLSSEINRIADSSNFNGIKLLDGSMELSAPEGGKEWAILSQVAGTASANQAGVGAKTILQKDEPTPQKTRFEVDLGDITLTNTKSSAKTFQLKIGSKLTLKATLGSKATLNATSLAQKLKANFTGKAASQQKLYTGSTAAKFTVTAQGNKLIFEMAEMPTAQTTDNDLKGSYDLTFTPGGDITQTSTTTPKTVTIQDGVKPGGGQLASTKITLTTDMVKDGAGVQIGNETYVFKTSKDSDVTAGTGQKLVDVSDVADPTTGEIKEADLHKVVDALTRAAADNEMFMVSKGTQNNNAGDGDIVVHQKATYDGDADLKTKEGFQAQLKTFTPNALKKAAQGGLSLQIGDTADAFNKLTVSIGDMHTKALGIDTINIGTQAGASVAIDKIKSAINQVSSVRGDLGATQNRLEHTQNNLSVMSENIQDAESTIRDTDVAAEMMKYTKNNILIQSAQAMLAQANQAPQGVLQLLG